MKATAQIPLLSLQNAKPRAHALLGFFVLVLVVGCGGTSSQPSGLTTTIRIDHRDLESIDPNTDLFRFTAYNSKGEPVFGPIELAKAATERLPAVPLEAVRLRIDYVDVVSLNGIAERDLGEKDVRLTLQVNQEELVALAGDPLAPVHFLQTDGVWQMICDGNPTVMKGIGMDYAGPSFDWNQAAFGSGAWFSYLSGDLQASGANVIRTYGVPFNSVYPPGSASNQAAIISNLLALAKSASTSTNKVWVLAGVLIDGSATDTEVEQLVTLVQQDPNYDHLLGWCLGNEVATSYYSLINTIAGNIKTNEMTSSSLKRPIMTAHNVISGSDITNLVAALPNLDWLGINNFMGAFDATHSGGGYLAQQAADLQAENFNWPWAITEYYSYDFGGVNIPTAFGTVTLELNSTSNAQQYINGYNLITSSAFQTAGCVGGSVLNWGPPHNSQTVGFWKQMYTYTGNPASFVNPPWSGGTTFYRLECCDAVASLYGGTGWPMPPQIQLGADNDPQGITCSFKATENGNGPGLAQGAQATATILVEGGSVSFNWYLIGGTANNIFGGSTNPQNYVAYTQLIAPGGTIPGSHVDTQSNGIWTSTLTFTLPASAPVGNVYQLRCIANDNNNCAATASVFFNVTAP